MKLDDNLCLCFHITKRKVINFIRIEQPQKASQLSECGGAGTGCGWCRPYLEQLLAAKLADDNATEATDLPSADDYFSARSKYVKDGGGTPPPGATPVD